ncbi:Alcohol dehydrogenase zinc-binding domain protein [Kribbella flavida DSM 17836]|uniref:Alcohol dehydrogenase zinc-binding domain protein n=1 Tax=Kribbella flavida (strain DSM 17836 / JCM 10339 / NBRC 14399) TaxID=479435 RepID=D2PTN0_KRIFD|nr:quinone oxidoreductase [Kribbella flavida]ADB31343.1 Alcohol dehydrogenase zinc-binding domain protein [Kribbella flavida DSM 17836]
MRVVEVAGHGGAEMLRIVERPSPVPAPHEVRVRVAAIGVNYLDVQERTGAYPRKTPYVPGDEGSGTIVDVGAHVTGWVPGHRVCWQGITGSYAEELVIPADRLIAVPDGISDQLAAALPTQGLTAHYLATDSYVVGPGDLVVVLAGAGGVGLLLTQIAKVRGARVITTVSTPDKAELSRKAGADRVVAYEDLVDAVREESTSRGRSAQGAAVVYDSVGRATFEDSLRCLGRRGTLVLYGQSSGPVPPFDLRRLGPAGSLTVTRPTLRDFVVGDELPRRATELFGWVTDGDVTPYVGQTYAFAEAARAHADLEARRTVGKVLLVP